MAIVRAVKSGNWSDTTVWNTGALPTSADDVYSNTFTVTIDQNVTVLSISNASATGVTAGGSFQIIANGITLTANINAGNTASITCLTVNVSAGNTVNIVGNCNAGTNTSAIAVANASTGTLNITGNCFAGQAANANGANNNAGGSINLTGNATGGNVTNNYGIANNASGTITITGSCIGSSTANAGPGAYNASTGVLNHAGIVQSGNTAPGIINASTGAAILTGPFLTNANGWPPVSGRWFWQNTTPPATYYQIRSANLAVIRPLYTADSVGGNPATSNVRSGTVYGPNNELTGTCAVPGASSVVVGVPVDNTVGTAAVTAATIRSALGLASANLDTQLAAIPTTAAPTAAAIRSEMDSNSTKLANLDATVSSRSTYSGGDTSGTTTLLSRLTSTRAGYLDNLSAAPPSAADIATAVWAAATRTLTTAIDNSATIAAAVWSYATGRTITGGTVDTLTNAPSVPSAAAIASQVRTELTPELAHLDADVSSRLKPADTLARVTLVDTTTALTNAPDVPTEAEIATAVREELAPELARVANAATTQEVGDIVESALQPPPET